VILGIETSCDETAAALITREGSIRSSIVASQAELHARFGGVVPEVASRRQRWSRASGRCGPTRLSCRRRLNFVVMPAKAGIQLQESRPE